MHLICMIMSFLLNMVDEDNIEGRTIHFTAPNLSAQHLTKAIVKSSSTCYFKNSFYRVIWDEHMYVGSHDHV